MVTMKRPILTPTPSAGSLTLHSEVVSTTATWPSLLPSIETLALQSVDERNATFASLPTKELKLLFDKFVKDSAVVYNNGVHDGRSMMIFELHELRHKVDESEKKAVELNEKLNHKEQELRELMIVVESKRDQAETERAEIMGRLEAKVKECQEVQDMIAAERRDVAQVGEKHVKVLEELQRVMKTERGEYERKLMVLNTKFEECKASLDADEVVISILEKEKEELIMRESLITAIRENLEKTQQLHVEAAIKCEDQELKIQMLEKDKRTHHDSVARLQRRVDEAERSSSSLSTQLANQEKATSHVKTKEKEVEIMVCMLETARTEFNQSKKENTNLAARVATLESEIKQLKQEKQDLTGKVETIGVFRVQSEKATKLNADL